MPTYDERLDAALLAQSGARAGQRATIDALRTAYPHEPGGLALDVLAALWRGELEEARALAEEMGDRPAERAVRAELDGYEGDREAAGRSLESALVAAPDDPIVLRCAHSVLGIDDPERALAIARRRVALRPHDPSAYGALGTSLLASSVEEAEGLAAVPPPAFRDTSSHCLLRARLAMKRRDLGAAETHARAAVAANADSDMAWTTLADILRHLGRKEEAERAARFSLELNRRNPLAMRALGALASARGDREAAARWEREAQAAIPALAFLAAYRKASALARQGRSREALVELETLVAVPGHSRRTARGLRANLLLGMSDDEALREEADALEREGPEGATLERARAELDRRAGRLPEARARLEIAHARWPGTVTGDLIAVLAASGDLDAARQAALDVPGTPVDAATTFLALDKAGLGPEAVAFLALAQRRYPEAQVLRLLRVGSLARGGDVPGMVHAMRGLDAEHRPRIRVRLSPRHLLRLLWRRAVRRGKGGR